LHTKIVGISAVFGSAGQALYLRNSDYQAYMELGLTTAERIASLPFREHRSAHLVHYVLYV
jgi:hypothetical protein